jgi:hypothetical protein
MAGPFSGWNPLNNYVQPGLVDGRFVSGGLTMIAAGPPRLSQLGIPTQGVAGALDASANAGGGDIVYPIGVTQNVNHSQNKTFMRVWELGSERSYFIGGRTVGQLGLSRVYYHGASLLRILYGYYQDLIGAVQVPWMFPNPGAENMANPHDVIVPPGYENFFLNLASDLFNQPIGLLLFMRDSNLDTIGAVYLEACYVPNHTWATDAQGTIVQETVAIQYELVRPVNVHAVALINGLQESVNMLASAVAA